MLYMLVVKPGLLARIEVIPGAVEATRIRIARFVEEPGQYILGREVGVVMLGIEISGKEDVFRLVGR
jgi:hypothetical protein